MNDRSRKDGSSGVFIGLGALLVVLGMLFLAGQAIGFELGRFDGRSSSSSPGSRC